MHWQDDNFIKFRKLMLWLATRSHQFRKLIFFHKKLDLITASIFCMLDVLTSYYYLLKMAKFRTLVFWHKRDLVHASDLCKLTFDKVLLFHQNDKLHRNILITKGMRSVHQISTQKCRKLMHWISILGR